MNKLEFDLASNVIRTKISLYNKNTGVFQNMIITVDTGASVTTISKDILQFLGYSLENTHIERIATASGIEYVNVVIIDKMKIGNTILENVQVYAHTFPEASFTDGLLGLNVLKQFDVNLLFSAKEIALTKIDE